MQKPLNSNSSAVSAPSSSFPDEDHFKLRVQELNELGGEEFIADLATIFMTDATQEMKFLDAAVQANARENIQKLSHKIKAYFRQFGLLTLANALENLEKSSHLPASTQANLTLRETHLHFSELYEGSRLRLIERLQHLARKSA